MLKKNTTGAPIYRICIDVESLKGLTFDSELVGGTVSISLGAVTLKSIGGNMHGRKDDIIELSCVSDMATVSIAKKETTKGKPLDRSTSNGQGSGEPEV